MKKEKTYTQEEIFAAKEKVKEVWREMFNKPSGKTTTEDLLSPVNRMEERGTYKK